MFGFDFLFRLHLLGIWTLAGVNVVTQLTCLVTARFFASQYFRMISISSKSFSHVQLLESESYPFHFTKYHRLPSIRLSSRIASTSNEGSVSSAIGERGLSCEGAYRRGKAFPSRSTSSYDPP